MSLQRGPQRVSIHISALSIVLTDSPALFLSLGWLDRLLAPLIIIFMIVGCAVGATTGDAVPRAFNTVQLKGVSLRRSRKITPESPYLTVFRPNSYRYRLAGHVSLSSVFNIRLTSYTRMWPVLTKVQYERLPEILSTRKIWIHIGVSLVLNWLIGPFLMLGLAWATLPVCRLRHEQQE